MKINILIAVLCSLLISCASQSPSDQGAEVPSIDTSVLPDQEATPGMGQTPQVVEQAQASGDFPVDMPVAQVPPGVEQVTVDEKAPEKIPDLKPVNPVSSWSAAGVTPAPSKKASVAKSSAKSKAKAKKAAALAKKNKKGKSLAKKPSKAECKKFAKTAKKHKKELALCKIDKKKTAGKSKKSGRVARR